MELWVNQANLSYLSESTLDICLAIALECVQLSSDKDLMFCATFMEPFRSLHMAVTMNNHCAFGWHFLPCV